MDLGLRGKVALVAAASRGLGRAIASELAQEGATLLICARGRDALDATRNDIATRTGATVRAVIADLSMREHIDVVVKEAMSAFGRVDVLVTNAGGPPAGPFEAHGWDAWERAVNLTLRSAVELTRAV